MYLGFGLAALFYASGVNAGIIGKPPTNLGLVGYWSMNEGTGAYAGDASGNKNTGTLTNGPTWVDGKRGKALNFDGVNDYVSIPTISIPSSITASAWVYSGNFNQTGFIVGKAPVNTQWQLFFEGTVLFWRSSADGQQINCAIPSNGRWHHVVGTQSGTSAFLYIDGAQCNTGTISAIGNGAGAVEIGRHSAESYYFTGKIDEVRVYNRALSAAEVQYLYKSGAAKFKFPSITRTSLTSGFDNAPVGTCTTASVTPTSNALALIAVFHSSGSDPTVSGNSLTWVKVDRQNRSGASNNNVTIYRALGASPTAGAITITTDASRCAWSVVEYMGVDTSGTNGSGAIVQTAKGDNGFSGSLTLTLAAFSSIYNATYGALFLDNDCNLMSITPGSGFTQIHKTSGSTSNCGQTQDQLANDTIVDWTHTNAWNAGIAMEIKAKPRSTKINTSQNSKITNGLVGLWSFNGPDMSDNTAYDRSGNSNNGTLTNGPTRAAGKVGQALEFDNSNDTVNAGDIAIIDTATQLSICAWVYHKTLTNDDVIANKYVGATDDGITFLRDDVGGVSGRTDTYSFRVAENGTAAAAQLEGATGASLLNTWTHVCGTVVLNNSTGLRLYINGVEDSNSPVSTVGVDTIDAGTRVLDIGSIQSVSVFSGIIDEVRVYDRVLTPAEIKRLYNMGR